MSDKSEDFKPADAPPGVGIESCPVCGSTAALWQRSANFKEGPILKAVMCSNGDPFGPQEADGGITNAGCLLYMPPEPFYRDRITDAIRYWNEYAKTLSTIRRRNHWETAQVLRGNPTRADAPPCGS